MEDNVHTHFSVADWRSISNVFVALQRNVQSSKLYLGFGRRRQKAGLKGEVFCLKEGKNQFLYSLNSILTAHIYVLHSLHPFELAPDLSHFQHGRQLTEYLPHQTKSKHIATPKQGERAT